MIKILIASVALTASCSSLPSSQGNKATPSPAQREFHLNIPKVTWEPIFFEAIDERAKLSNLKNLRAPLPNEDLEVRIWHGFGLTPLEGFVLQRAAGQWSAIRLDGISRNVVSPESKIALQEPKSGWDATWQRLHAAGILNLPDATAIGCTAMINDGMSYVVEYNYEGTYRTYLYDNPDYAKCNEAKRMIQIGNLIAEEFALPEMATK